MDFQKPKEIPSWILEKFSAYPEDVQKRLFEMRKFILDLGLSLEGCGGIEESLKWGDLSFCPKAKKCGSSIRIAYKPSKEKEYGIYFNCRTCLVKNFRELYPQIFRFENNRAIIFYVKDEFPKKELQECILAAFTYFLES